MNNNRTVRYKNFLLSSGSKLYLLIGIALITLIALILSLSLSSGKKAETRFDFSVDKQQIAEVNKDNSTLKSVGNSITYTDDEIEFLKGEEVTVKYYFAGKNDNLSKITYDVTECDEKKVEDMIKSFNKTYKKLKSSENTISNSTKLRIRWVSDDMRIHYEKHTSTDDDANQTIHSMRFTFIPIKK